MREITLTEEDFKDIASDVAVSLMEEAQAHNVSPHIVGLLTALYCAKLHTALFDNDKLEVE